MTIAGRSRGKQTHLRTVLATTVRHLAREQYRMVPNTSTVKKLMAEIETLKENIKALEIAIAEAEEIEANV